MSATRHTWLRCPICERDVWSEEGGYVAAHWDSVGPKGVQCNGSGGLSQQEMNKGAEA